MTTFQLNTNNYINENNYIVISEDSEIELDDDLNDMHIDDEARIRENQEASQTTGSQELRLLQGRNLQRLGEGRVHFTRTPLVDNLFRTYKVDMANHRNVQLEHHEQEEQYERVFSSTPRRRTYTQAQVDSIKRQTSQETLYSLYMSLENDLDKEGMKKIQEKIGITDRTVRNIKKRKNNDEPLTGRKRGRVEGSQMKASIEGEDWLRNRVDNNPTITIRELEKEMALASDRNEEFLALKRTSISSLLSNMGYSRKRIDKQPINRNTIDSLKKRVIWGTLFCGLVKQDVQFCFIDECGFSRAQTRNYGYSPVGQSTSVTVDKVRHPNHTVVAAMIVGQEFYLEIMEGACNNERFREFCRNLIVVLKQKLDLRKPLVVVLDNARIHAKNIHQIFWQHHIYVLKTIPYSPQTNPIELSFSQAKNEMSNLYGSDILYAETMKQILLDKIDNEYNQKMNELIRTYGVGDEGLEINEINSNARVLDEKLNELDRWKEREVNECNIRATDVHPTSDTIDEPTYQAMIIHAFKKISVSNTYHYLGRSIKVADSCIHGYPLVNFKSFYQNYLTGDLQLGEICERFLNFN